jgi:hypothetical protein
MGFVADLSFGKYYEEIAIKLLKDEVVTHRPEGKFSEYDFKTDKESYEVKADRITYRTRNMFIEYENNGRDSGIHVTTATYWYYFVVLPLSLNTYPANYRVYRIPVSFIKECMKDARSMCGAERSKGYLIPEEKFKSFLVQTADEEQLPSLP